jgi:endonuclease YncB( thermonuclease family)
MRVRGAGSFGAVAAAVVAATALAWAATAAAAENPISACKEAGEPFATVAAVGARDGATVRLADGRELRLAGVLAANELDGDDAAMRRATEALDGLVAGKRLALYGKPDNKDRYGRTVAQAALADEPRWIVAELVARGELRVAPEAGAPACTESLLVHERAARTGGLGLWPDPRFAVQDANALDALLAASGRFAVVEGTVRRVGESGRRLFLDFGPRYTRDFTVVVARTARAAFEAAGVDPKQARGKRVRARGVLYAWGGPALEVHGPAAIEFLPESGS